MKSSSVEIKSRRAFALAPIEGAPSSRTYVSGPFCLRLSEMDFIAVTDRLLRLA